MRVVTLDDWNKADIVAKYKVWGQSRNVFRGWTKAEILIILVATEGAIVGVVSGAASRSALMIWSNELYEWRLPLEDIRRYDGAAGEELNRGVRKALLDAYGPKYGFTMLNQQRLNEEAEAAITILLK
ncbi:MAG TPA: hypothetical protein VIK22_01190 [Candidatus Anoxymicrobiaceae bacterium]